MLFFPLCLQQSFTLCILLVDTGQRNEEITKQIVIKQQHCHILKHYVFAVESIQPSVVEMDGQEIREITKGKKIYLESIE